jgi:hypothetical protein
MSLTKKTDESVTEMVVCPTDSCEEVVVTASLKYASEDPHTDTFNEFPKEPAYFAVQLPTVPACEPSW